MQPQSRRWNCQQVRDGQQKGRLKTYCALTSNKWLFQEPPSMLQSITSIYKFILSFFHGRYLAIRQIWPCVVTFTKCLCFYFKKILAVSWNLFSAKILVRLQEIFWINRAASSWTTIIIVTLTDQSTSKTLFYIWSECKLLSTFKFLRVFNHTVNALMKIKH